MDVVHPICCGIDVHQAQVTACLRRVVSGGTVSKELKEFPTTTQGLLEFKAWLVENDCPVVAMESTGVYWKPVYHILNDAVEVIVGNSRDIKIIPGKKTDDADADWISELLAHGLIRPSFVPSPEFCAMRDLTRTRVKIVEMRTQAKNRVHKTLEDCNIKLSTFVSDVFGVSGRQMLDALVAGERNAKVLAQMARGKMKRKIAQLELALTGQFTEHHGRLIKLSLEQIDLFNRQLETMDAQMSELFAPYASEIERLCSIPGIEETAARAILAEIGVDMSRFATPERLASWAGISPGNNESAGKKRKGRTRKGNRWLRRILGQCGWNTRKGSSFLGQTFRRHNKRLGGKKAAMAVGHKILVIIYHLLNDGTYYEEQRYEARRGKGEQHQINRAVKQLESLGFTVVLQQPPETLQPSPRLEAELSTSSGLASQMGGTEQAAAT